MPPNPPPTWNTGTGAKPEHGYRSLTPARGERPVGGDPNLIAEANAKMTKALDKIDKALNEYKRAWEKARDTVLP